MAAASVGTIAREGSRVNPPEEGGLPDLRIVALGGGTGLPTVLHGLRAGLFESYPWDPERDQTRLAAVATAADDGGGAGTLRATYRLPSPGAVWTCLFALAGADPPLAAAS